MRVKLQLVMCSDDGQEETITDLVTLQKDSQCIEHLDLTLREAKQLLNTIQKRMLNLKSEIGNRGKPIKPKPFTLYNAGLYDFPTLKQLPWAD